MIVKKGSIFLVSFHDQHQTTEVIVVVLLDPKERACADLVPARHLFADTEVRWAIAPALEIRCGSEGLIPKKPISMSELPMSFVESGRPWCKSVGGYTLRLTML